jgi:hypothetical protein
VAGAEGRNICPAQFVRHTCSDRATLMLTASYLPLLGSGKPSSVHEICGVGLPAALHFRDTAGPGCRVCSMKLYSRTGGASATEGPVSVPSYICDRSTSSNCAPPPPACQQLLHFSAGDVDSTCRLRRPPCLCKLAYIRRTQIAS